mmetsp:Transcript_7204/g.12165  ORF Transcript_7204/g.12165 Transcript_7204/m.12165 type:complete len:81 (+) Transcript_7204:243-485(+)
MTPNKLQNVASEIKKRTIEIQSNRQMSQGHMKSSFVNNRGSQDQPKGVMGTSVSQNSNVNLSMPKIDSHLLINEVRIEQS